MQPQELSDHLQSGAPVHVLDIRTPAEFETAHLPGSYNLPLDQLREHGQALSAAAAPLVLVCRTGNRAREAQVLLHSAGREGIDVLDGGLVAWEQAGLPVERGRPRWSLERQVRAVAGGLILAGALGGLVAWRPLGALAAAVGGGLFTQASATLVEWRRCSLACPTIRAPAATCAGHWPPSARAQPRMRLPAHRSRAPASPERPVRKECSPWPALHPMSAASGSCVRRAC
jgi:rhodanese-related sulfurtransferase